MKAHANSACYKAKAKDMRKRTSWEKLNFQGVGGGLGRDMDEREWNQNKLKTCIKLLKNNNYF